MSKRIMDQQEQGAVTRSRAKKRNVILAKEEIIIEGCKIGHKNKMKLVFSELRYAYRSKHPLNKKRYVNKEVLEKSKELTAMSEIEKVTGVEDLSILISEFLIDPKPTYDQCRAYYSREVMYEFEYVCRSYQFKQIMLFSTYSIFNELTWKKVCKFNYNSPHSY